MYASFMPYFINTIILWALSCNLQCKQSPNSTCVQTNKVPLFPSCSRWIRLVIPEERRHGEFVNERAKNVGLPPSFPSLHYYGPKWIHSSVIPLSASVNCQQSRESNQQWCWRLHDHLPQLHHRDERRPNVSKLSIHSFGTMGEGDRFYDKRGVPN